MNNSKRWVSWTLLGLAGEVRSPQPLLNGLEQNNYLFSPRAGAYWVPWLDRIIRTLYWLCPSRREERQPGSRNRRSAWGRAQNHAAPAVRLPDEPGDYVLRQLPAVPLLWIAESPSM